MTKTIAAIALFVSLVVTASHASTISSASLGTFRGTAGVYTIDTDTLSLSGSGGYEVFGELDRGVVSFTFDEFLLLPTASLTTTGSLPVEIVSNSSMDIIGLVTASSGGAPGGRFGASGSGLGGGRGYSENGAEGGGFGGRGGGPLGGSTYGDLTQLLQGGSGGGGTRGFFGSSSGGNGGGALRLKSLDRMGVYANLQANGGAGGGLGYGGGGGSGGGLILSAPEIIIGSTVSADGGRGGVGTFDNGAGGGGGRILIETDPGGLELFGSLSVAGGRGGTSFFESRPSGLEGTITIRTLPIPEPTGFVLMALGVASAWRFRGRVTQS